MMLSPEWACQWALVWALFTFYIKDLTKALYWSSPGWVCQWALEWVLHGRRCPSLPCTRYSRLRIDTVNTRYSHLSINLILTALKIFLCKNFWSFQSLSTLSLDHLGKLLHIKDDTGRILFILTKNLPSRHGVHSAQGTLTLQEQVWRNSDETSLNWTNIKDKCVSFYEVLTNTFLLEDI